MSAVSNGRRHIDDVFKPQKVWYVLGRSAKAQPMCDTADCLYYTWKDVYIGSTAQDHGCHRNNHEQDMIQLLSSMAPSHSTMYLIIKLHLCK